MGGKCTDGIYTWADESIVQIRIKHKLSLKGHETMKGCLKSPSTVMIDHMIIRLEIRNAELTESRRSKSGRSETVSSNEEQPEEKEDEVVVRDDKEDGEVTEEQEKGGKKDEEDEERRGRLSIALTNCGDVLERQLFDAIFWSV